MRDLSGDTDEYLLRWHYVLKDRCAKLARDLREAQRRVQVLERTLARENERLVHVDVERGCR